MSAHPDVATSTPATWSDLTPDGKGAAVRALAATGLSSSAMAAMLGTTKNSVLSVANRRRIPIGADIPVTTYSARLAARAMQPGREVAPQTWARLDALRAPPDVRIKFDAEWAARPTASPTRKECCWPVGEAGGSKQMFCGLPRHKQSYCTTHAAMASGRRPADHPYVDMLRAAPVPAEVTIEEAVALVLPPRKTKMEGAE